MRRPRRAARGRNALGLVLIGLVMAVLVGFAYAALMMRPPPVDAETLCRTDQPIAAHTYILVDSTDRLELRHRRKLRAVAEQERARLRQYDRLTLARINPRRPQEPTILFSKCLPRAPEDANPVFENPRLARAHWDADFQSALEAALRSAQHGGAGDASPILAGLRAAAADPNFGAEISTRRFVLVSDLLEHEPRGFSLYAEGADYAGWRTQAGHEAADFDNVDVRLAPLDRPDHAVRQTDAIARFWRPYFDEAGGKSLTIDPY